MFTRKRVIGAFIALVVLAAVAIGGYRAGLSEVSAPQPVVANISMLSDEDENVDTGNWMADPECPAGTSDRSVFAGGQSNEKDNGVRVTPSFDEFGVSQNLLIEADRSIEMVIPYEVHNPELTKYPAPTWGFWKYEPNERTTRLIIEGGAFGFAGNDQLMVCLR